MFCILKCHLFKVHLITVGPQALYCETGSWDDCITNNFTVVSQQIKADKQEMKELWTICQSFLQ